MTRFSYRDDILRDEILGIIFDMAWEALENLQSADKARPRTAASQVREAADAYLLYINEADDCDALISSAVPAILDALDRSPTARSR